MNVANRAYSVLEIKSVSEDRRIIRGVATTPATDRVGDIVEPMGVAFKNPMPLLWQHRHDKPVGTVKFDKPTEDGITFEAELPAVAEAGALRDRIEEAWQSIKLGLVRAVSIGFRAVEYAFMDEGGVRFTKSEVYELSLVTIPANADAVITSAKSLDHQTVSIIKKFDTSAPAATGQTDRSPKTSPAPREKATTKSNPRPKEANAMKTISEQIRDFEATRAAKAAELETIMTTTEGQTLDAEAAEAADTLADEIKSIDQHLKRLRLVESVKAGAARPIENVRTVEDGAAARSGSVPAQVRVKQRLEPGVAFARFAKVKAIANLDGVHPREIARDLYGENDPLHGMFAKSAVAAGTTTGWAGFLVGDETNIFADFAEYLRPRTILGRFGEGAVPSLRRVPFRTPLLSQTGKATGYWVGEGKAKPVTSMAGARTTLEPLQAGTIAVLTEQVVRDSSPSADMIVRDEIVKALRERLDTDFIDPAKAASSGVSPASITNGITPISSAGTDADAVREDVQALFQAFIDANNAPTSGVWIMPSTMALSLSLMQNPLGQTEFPGIGMYGGTFFGLPAIVSEYMPTITGGSYVALVNAQDIYFADDGDVVVDMSREASLQMDNEPTMNGDSPTGTSVVSLWQAGLVGFKAERTVNWARRRDSAVALLSGVAWSAAAA